MNELFEKLWASYPRKVGKSAVSAKAKKEIEKAGEEKILKAIENYKGFMATQPWRHWLDGSTFFNGRWKDYSDMPEINSRSVQKPVDNVKNHTGRTYDDDFFKKFGG